MAGKPFVDPVEYDTKVSNHNKAVVEDFLKELKATKKSPGTIRQYGYSLRLILTYIYRFLDNRSVLELTRKDLRDFCIWVQDNRGVSSSRVGSLLSAMSSMMEFVSDDDDYDYDNNEVRKVKRPARLPVREQSFLTERQIYLLRDALIDGGKLLQAVYLMLSYESAGRRNEVAQVLKDQLDCRFYTNVVIGKRSKRFRLCYGQHTQQLIKRYFELRGNDDLPQLFVKVNSAGIKSVVGYETLYDWAKSMARVLTRLEGHNINIWPHTFRHSRLTNLANGDNSLGKKFDLDHLKKLANHESIDTTNSYIKQDNSDDIAELFGLSPENFKF